VALSVRVHASMHQSSSHTFQRSLQLYSYSNQHRNKAVNSSVVLVIKTFLVMVIISLFSNHISYYLVLVFKVVGYSYG